MIWFKHLRKISIIPACIQDIRISIPVKVIQFEIG